MPPPVILFGAFDRHNFGDLLFPHVAAAMLPGRELHFAGLAERDLRPWGGHAVAALAGLRAAAGGCAPYLVHVGGEILTCSAWQAAVMLQPAGDVAATIAYLERRPRQRAAWVRRVVGTGALAPYVVSPRRLAGLAGIVHLGVGGAGLDEVDAALRAEVVAALASAQSVSVRDARTLAHLAAAGIAARLIPDPAVMVAELFGAPILAATRCGEVAQAARALPGGYLAVQFSADFADDRTLSEITAQLDRASARHGLGLVLFRAGAAPWHDDVDVLRRAAARLRPGTSRLFASLNLWDICALIAASRGFCGSSLHGRIVATAFALPSVGLRPPAGGGWPAKHAAYAATWGPDDGTADVMPSGLAAAIDTALSSGAASRHRRAADLARQFRRGFAAVCTRVVT